MSVVAIVLARDEADIIGSTVEHLLTQLDHVLVLDHLSVDGTGQIAADLGAEVRPAEGPRYDQANRMSMAAQEMWERGFDWIVPCDADELWTPANHDNAETGGTIRELLAYSDEKAMQALTFNYVATDSDDPTEPDPTRRLRYRSTLPRWTKVCVRACDGLTFTNGNHAASVSGRALGGPVALTIRHYPYRTVEQVIRNARNVAESYAALPAYPASDATHKRTLARMSDAELHSWWDREVIRDPSRNPSLVFDPRAS